MSNDRFKFRVWDKDEQHYLLEGSLLDGRTGKIAGYFDDYTFSVEQCTGLKDKNGKLIFENDVVSDMGIEAIVDWYYDSYMIEYDDGSISELAIAAEALEVIGNVHDEQFRDLTKMVEKERN